ncbi:MAG: NAD(P)H-dependent oxidoreductase [Lachnospiraceae bacterium]|nr:NAD(P)H-dependent oxidoreductase [Lachnospiraceae bacterium]
MKVVLIHGQNHKGSSYHIGRMIADKMQGTNEITEFFLPRDLNHFCLGCYNCIEDDAKCPFYDEKRKIMDAVEVADVLIFTTPTYCMHATAPMKSFMDLTFTYWMVHRPRKCMFSKRAVVVSTAAGTGMKSAIKDITNALFYWGVPYIKSYGVAVQAMSWDGVNEKKKVKIEKETAKLARKLSVGKKPSVGIKTRFMFKVMGGMQSAGMGSSPVEKEYWEQNGWLGKKRPWTD